VVKGSAARVRGGVATGESPERCSGVPKLTVRGQGGVGEDGEAGGDVSEALKGQR
jgi:hypothetical protein